MFLSKSQGIVSCTFNYYDVTKGELQDFNFYLLQGIDFEDQRFVFISICKCVFHSNIHTLNLSCTVHNTFELRVVFCSESGST